MCYASSMEALADRADPVRRELLDLLAGGELAAGELARRFPVSRPAISRHLRVLREAGLGTARTEGRRRLYALDARALREIDEWMEPYRDLWAQRLDALDTEIARGRRARTTGDRSCPRPSPTDAVSSPGKRTAGSGWSSAARGPTPSRTSGRP